VPLQLCSSSPWGTSRERLKFTMRYVPFLCVLSKGVVMSPWCGMAGNILHRDGILNYSLSPTTPDNEHYSTCCDLNEGCRRWRDVDMATLFASSSSATDAGTGTRTSQYQLLLALANCPSARPLLRFKLFTSQLLLPDHL
jgi:hypothetical protein